VIASNHLTAANRRFPFLFGAAFRFGSSSSAQPVLPAPVAEQERSPTCVAS